MDTAQNPEFERLVAEGWEHSFSGWDFGFIAGRMVESPLPWDYTQRVRAHFRPEGALLDMGTGGGELLSSLGPLPHRTVAIESYAPNVRVAGARLRPLGVGVVAVGLALDQALPFASETFDLVINRHDGYAPAEVYRTLKPGRRFITQQVGGQNMLGLNERLQDRVDFEFEDWTLDKAQRELVEAGFEIIEAREAFPEVHFADIGAVVYHLKVIAWQVAGFTPERYWDRLAAIDVEIHQKGSLRVDEHRFFIEALKC